MTSASSTAGAPLKYRADIDGLRAIAVLLVLVFHFDLPWTGKAGFIGVDVFYVISGFLITAIIKTQLDQNTFSLKTFYLNRIRRLAPALFVVLVLVMAAGAVWLFPEDFDELSKQVFFSQTYLANFYYWRNINYFGLKSDNVLLLHTWSLAVEEQFYLFYPLALWLVHRYLRKYFWAVLVLGFVFSFALNILFVSDKPEATFYLLPTRAWELLAGGLVHFVHMHWRRSRAANELSGFLGLGLIFGAVAFFNVEIRFPGYFALLPTLGAVCLILSGTGGQTFVSRLLCRSPVVYVGKISYPLYLVHWPVNVFAKMLLGENYSLPWRLGMFAFSILLSAIIYHAVEGPFRHRRVLAADGRLLQGYAAGILATTLMFVTVQTTGGLPARFPHEVLRLAGFANDKTAALPECEFAGRPLAGEADFCRIGVPGKTPEWLIYGDSHAWAAHGAFDQWLKLKGEAGLFKFRNSCPPVSGIHLFQDKGRCFAFNQAIAGFLGNNSGIRNVLIVSTWRQVIEARISTSTEIKLPVEAAIQLFEERFTATLENLNRLGLHVYVWEPVPGARRDVPHALAKAALTHQADDLEFRRDEYFSIFGYFFKALEKNRRLVTLSFSPSAALCDEAKCAVTINGNPAYFDNDHITKSSADFWVQMMLRAEAQSGARPAPATESSKVVIPH